MRLLDRCRRLAHKISHWELCLLPRPRSLHRLPPRRSLRHRLRRLLILRPQRLLRRLVLHLRWIGFSPSWRGCSPVVLLVVAALAVEGLALLLVLAAILR